MLKLSGSHLVAGLTAVFLLIMGFALCVPLATRVLSVLLAPLAGKLGGTPARLAVSGIGANLSRTGVAIVALAVAVSATIGVSVMVQSFRDSVITWLDRTLQSDLYVASPGAPLDAGLIDDLVRAPGVEAFSATRRIWLERARPHRRSPVTSRVACGRFNSSLVSRRSMRRRRPPRPTIRSSPRGRSRCSRTSVVAGATKRSPMSST